MTANSSLKAKACFSLRFTLTILPEGSVNGLVGGLVGGVCAPQQKTVGSSGAHKAPATGAEPPLRRISITEFY